jgi:predicted transcriptional regulator
MYSHVIRSQVEALQKAGLLKTGVTIDQAEECLQKACWSDQIAIVWTIEDVLEHARQLKVRITKAQARAILFQVQNKHDASLGINWDTLEFHIREAKR